MICSPSDHLSEKLVISYACPGAGAFWAESVILEKTSNVERVYTYVCIFLLVKEKPKERKGKAGKLS